IGCGRVGTPGALPQTMRSLSSLPGLLGRVLGAFGLFVLGACSASGGDAAQAADQTAAPPDSPAQEAPAPAPTNAPNQDHGSISTTSPAFRPDVPLLKNNGGHVLSSPVIVAVTWQDNANTATYEALVDKIGSTAYWKDVVGEYGVGPATSGAANHVHETSA